MKSHKKAVAVTKKWALIPLALSIVAIMASYITTQTSLMRTELRNFTTEIRNDTRENVTAAKNLLDGMVADLKYTASEISEHENPWSSEVLNVLEFSERMNSFDVTFISDTEGNAYASTGETFSIADQEFFRNAMEENDVVFSEVLPSKRFKAIQIVSLPLYSDTQEQIGALFGLFNIETFSRLINTVVDHDEHIYVVDSNGMYINCFDPNHFVSDYENFWKDLELRELQDTTISELQADFHAGKEGDFSFIHDGVQRYGCHIPLGVKDWQIILTVDETVMDTHIHSIQSLIMTDLLVNLVCLVVMILSIYFYFRRANLEILKTNQELSKSGEMMKMAAEFSNHVIFEYDINEKKIELKTEFSNPLFPSSVLTSVPECFAQMNVLADDSIPVIKELFDTIKTGPSSQADIQLISSTQEKIWYRVAMHNVYDDAGHIVGTVGSAADISILKKGEIAIKRKQETHRTLISNALLYARIDLSTGTVLELNGDDVQLSYQDSMDENIIPCVIEEHQSYVAQALSLETLQQEYRQGKEYLEVQCVMKNESAAKWVSCLVYRIHESDSSNVTFLIMDIDDKKREEISLKEQAERDGLTGLYNATTTRSKIKEVLQSMHSSGENQIFVLLDLDNFKQINDTFGHSQGDQVLIDSANILKKCFRSSDIIGRIGGDEFAILLCNVRSGSFADDLLKSLRSSLTQTYTQGDVSLTVSASIGVAMAPSDGTTFEELYKKADIALYQVKKRGKNGYQRFE